MPRLTHDLIHRGLLLCALGFTGVACTARDTAPPAASGHPGESAGDYDVVLSNGHIIDGTGNPWFAGDIAIKGDRIARVTPAGTLANAHAARRVDAAGMVIAPG